MGIARVFDVRRDAGSPDEVSGADVVVIAADQSHDWAETIRVRAPNAVVVVVGGSPQPICETTLFPRSRIIGVEDEAAAAVVEAVVNDLDKEFDAVVRCEGERGVDGEFARVPVRIGARGIVEILES